MIIIHRYITADFIISFLMTVTIFTFVMCSAAIVKAIDLMTRGISGWVILQVFLYNMPYILAFSIPMSVMTTMLLLFSRLSFDGEITALKASGMSLWQIVAPLVLVCVVFSIGCIYVNGVLAPNSRFARQNALHSMGITDPLGLLDEGRFVSEFPGLKIYIGKKDKKGIEDIIVFETGTEGVKQQVRAKRGTVTMNEKGDTVVINLFDVNISRPDPSDPLNPSKARRLTAESYPVSLDISGLQHDGTVNKRTKDQTLPELLHVITNIDEVYPNAPPEFLSKQRTKKLVAANKRVAISFSCLAFGMLAIPLGMRSKRKESSLGVGISLGVIMIFYAFMLFAESVIKYPHLRPEILIWVPVLLTQAVGVYLINRMN